jgi:hypothetical protein
LKNRKDDTTLQGMLKVIAGIALVLAATAEVGHVPTGPTQQPAATCVTLRALQSAGLAA